MMRAFWDKPSLFDDRPVRESIHKFVGNTTLKRMYTIGVVCLYVFILLENNEGFCILSFGIRSCLRKTVVFPLVIFLEQ